MIPLRNLITIGIEAHLSVKNDTAFDSDFWPGGGRLFFLDRDVPHVGWKR